MFIGLMIMSCEMLEVLVLHEVHALRLPQVRSHRVDTLNTAGHWQEQGSRLADDPLLLCEQALPDHDRHSSKCTYTSLSSQASSLAIR